MFHTATDAKASEDRASHERLPSEPEDAAAAAVQDPIDAAEDLPFRAQVAFGTYPEWRFRVPVMTPSTFGAMANTLTKFPHAITEV